jgi:hypothetical protein
MNNNFSEQNNDLKRVAEEISLLRRDIQTASTTLGRIERRLKVAFPDFPNKQKQFTKNKKTGKTPSSKTPHELQVIFDDLVSSTQSEGDSAFRSRIKQYSDEDIIALAVEVGMGSASRLSRLKATVAIRKRVQEALQLQFENKYPPYQISLSDSSFTEPMTSIVGQHDIKKD